MNIVIRVFCAIVGTFTLMTSIWGAGHPEFFVSVATMIGDESFIFAPTVFAAMGMLFLYQAFRKPWRRISPLSTEQFGLDHPRS